MARYLITHSLLTSWLYAIKENPFEDMTTERDPMADFMTVLRREPKERTPAMQDGIDFEGLVTVIVKGGGDPRDKWYDAASQIAAVAKGGLLQYRAKREIQVGDMTVLLYGILDVLKAGVIYDIKFSKSYERGKYLSSTQHPAYFELVPEAEEFSYLVSNGQYVWTESYRRSETPSIVPTISDFFSWLQAFGLMDLYKEKWKADRPKPNPVKQLPQEPASDSNASVDAAFKQIMNREARQLTREVFQGAFEP